MGGGFARVECPHVHGEKRYAHNHGKIPRQHGDGWLPERCCFPSTSLELTGCDCFVLTVAEGLISLASER